MTSRPTAVDSDWLHDLGFDVAELQPMELSDIHNFIDHWHNAVNSIMPDALDEHELQRLTSNLKRVVKENRAIRNLATNPLLCAMLCALHRDLRKQLPKDRIELYDACSRMLLDRRDVERGIQIPNHPSLSYRQKRNLLDRLAHYLILNFRSEIELDVAERRLKDRLKGMDGFSEDDASWVLKYLLERSGVIREPVQGYMDFSHRTFQEFYAAQEFLNSEDIDFLVRHAHDDSFREVIILAAGLARRNERTNIIKKIVDRGDEESENRHPLHLLAVACLETSVEIDEDVRQDLDDRLQKLMPPTSVSEAKALASAGNLAVPHLVQYTGSNANEAAMCVRALAFIASESALLAIENYATDTRKTVIREVLRSADYFDVEEFGRRIITRISPKLMGLVFEQQDPYKILPYVRDTSTIEELNLTDANLPRLSNLPNLRKLNIQVASHEETLDLRPLHQFEQLTELNIQPKWGMYFVKLGEFARLHGLETLDVRGGIVEDSSLEFLANLPKLEHLILNTASSSSDFAALPRRPYSRLKTCIIDIPMYNPELLKSEVMTILRLDIGHSNELDFLLKLPSIQILELSSHSVTDISSIRSLKALKHLRITMPGVRDLDVFSHLQLRSLDIVDYLGTNLTGLIGLKRLVSLKLVTPNMKSLDNITNMRSLKSLLLWGEKLRDVSVINGLPKLESLVIGNSNELTTLNLSGLANLRALHLVNLPKLREVHLTQSDTRLHIHTVNCPQLDRENITINLARSVRAPGRFYSITKTVTTLLMDQNEEEYLPYLNLQLQRGLSLPPLHPSVYHPAYWLPIRANVRYIK